MDRLDELQRVTDAALAYLSLEDLLKELLDRISATLSSDTAAFLLLDEDTGELVARAAKGIEEEVEQGIRIPVGKGFAGRIAAERHPIYLPDVEHADVLNPILREKGIRSLLGVPMLIEGRVTRRAPRRHAHAARVHAPRTPSCCGWPPTAPPWRSTTRACISPSATRAQRAERSARQLSALQEVSDAALAYLPLEELLQELLLRISRILSSDTAAFLLLDEPSRTLVARAAKGHRGGGRAGRPDPARQGLRRPHRGRAPPDRTCPTSSTPTSSTRSCARRASAACSASR